MPGTREVVAAIYGAWRIMRFDAGGMAWFDVSLTGFWRSFFAAVLVAPGFAVLVALQLGSRTEPYDVGWAIAVSAVAYGTGWAVFPVVAIFITRMLGLGQRYFAFIIASNWANIPQMLVLLPAVAIDALGVAPAGVGPMLTLAATVFVLVYQWFVTRTALETTGLTASGIVVLQVLIGRFIDLGSNSLI